MWAKLMMILKGIGKFTMMMLQTEGTRIRNEIGLKVSFFGSWLVIFFPKFIKKGVFDED